MLDFFAAGLPAISTPTGARGLGIEDGRHCRVVEIDGFVDAIESFFQADDAVRDSMAREARSHVEEHFDWQRIAAKVKQELRVRSLAKASIPSDDSMILQVRSALWVRQRDRREVCDQNLVLHIVFDEDVRPSVEHPWAMIAFTRALNSGVLMKSLRSCSRVSAPELSWLIQKFTPARSPPRRRNA